MANENGNGSLHLMEHDTQPPGCPGPFLCEGLEQVITDMGLLRAQMDRIEANQSLILDEVKTLNQVVATALAKK
jgi:hypothetical protein